MGDWHVPSKFENTTIEFYLVEKRVQIQRGIRIETDDNT
jgi:hypothetical protein